MMIEDLHINVDLIVLLIPLYPVLMTHRIARLQSMFNTRHRRHMFLAMPKEYGTLGRLPHQMYDVFI